MSENDLFTKPYLLTPSDFNWMIRFNWIIVIGLFAIVPYLLRTQKSIINHR